jgi:hypothetical protein
MIELTEEQQQDLQKDHEHLVRVMNPRTQETFLLLPAELYERVRAILEEKDEIASIEEMYPLVNQALDLP